jgi:hypothetical protein
MLYLRSLIITFIILGASGCLFAQTHRSGDRLPRVGFIKDDQPSGRPHEGCDNHYLYLKKGGEKSVFTSDANGFDAWMNLDGQNVELKLVKATLNYRDPFDALARYDYRLKGLRFTVSLRHLSDYTVWIPARIILRSGRAVRVIRAFVTPQCD